MKLIKNDVIKRMEYLCGKTDASDKQMEVTHYEKGSMLTQYYEIIQIYIIKT